MLRRNTSSVPSVPTVADVSAVVATCRTWARIRRSTCSGEPARAGRSCAGSRTWPLAGTGRRLAHYTAVWARRPVTKTAAACVPTHNDGASLLALGGSGVQVLAAGRLDRPHL